MADTAITDVEKSERPPDEASAPAVESSSLTLTSSDPPPSYDSIYGRVRAARRESGGDHLTFLRTFLAIIFGSIWSIVVLAVFIAIPVSMIAIGSIYLRDCPRERYIPIYLIVGGVFGVVLQISRIGYQAVHKRRNANDDTTAKPNFFDCILFSFLLAWFIAGNVWVYRIKNDFTSDKDDPIKYCHPTLYWYSFWLITSVYIASAVGCCCLCWCTVCCACLAGNTASSD